MSTNELDPMVSLKVCILVTLQACLLVSADPTCGLKAHRSTVLVGKHVKRSGPKPPALAAWNCTESLDDLKTGLSCMFECRVLAQIMFSNTTNVCPTVTTMTTHVVLNKHNPTDLLLVTMQSDASTSKEVTYRSVTDTSKVLRASPWTTSSTGGIVESSAGLCRPARLHRVFL